MRSATGVALIPLFAQGYLVGSFVPMPWAVLVGAVVGALLVRLIDYVLSLVEWWNWPIVQWWWHGQYRRADRRALEREIKAIRVRMLACASELHDRPDQ